MGILAKHKKQVLFAFSALIYLAIWLLCAQIVHTILNIILFIIIFAWCAYTQKFKPLLFFILFAAAISLVGTVLRQPIAVCKFQLLNDFYQREAERCCLTLQAPGDIPYHGQKGGDMLSNWGNIEIQKTNGTISLYLPISESFFNSYGYLYVSNMEQSQENHTFSFEEADNYFILNDNWAYIKLF